MKLIPILTEKSLEEAKKGKYTFLVDSDMNKPDVKCVIDTVFKVHTKHVRIISSQGGTKKNSRGKIQRIARRKKAIISLKSGEKIDLFEEKAKGKSKK